MTPAQEARMWRRVVVACEANTPVLNLRDALKLAEAAYRAGYSDGRQDGADTGGEA